MDTYTILIIHFYNDKLIYFNNKANEIKRELLSVDLLCTYTRRQQIRM
jgi:hypothetical protein